MMMIIKFWRRSKRPETCIFQLPFMQKTTKLSKQQYAVLNMQAAMILMLTLKHIRKPLKQKP